MKMRTIEFYVRVLAQVPENKMTSELCLNTIDNRSINDHLVVLNENFDRVPDAKLIEYETMEVVEPEE